MAEENTTVEVVKRKVGGARPGSGRKDERKGVRRNYQFDNDNVAMLNDLFPVAHLKRLLKNGQYRTRSKFINDWVRKGCLFELGFSKEENAEN